MRNVSKLIAAVLLMAALGGGAAGAESLFERVLQLNHIQEPELSVDDVRKEFNGLVQKARVELRAVKLPREKIAILNTVLLTEPGFSYQSNMFWRDGTLAASLLRKKGNCMASVTLYLLAGEELKLPLRMVRIPRHAFVRWDDGETRVNIETTDGGAEHSDLDYLTRWSQPQFDEIEKMGLGQNIER